jgi:hypothetical protein
VDQPYRLRPRASSPPSSVILTRSLLTSPISPKTKLPPLRLQ